MISISLPLPPTGLRAPGSPASPAPPGDFALALADMLAAPHAGVEPPAAAVDRQIDAGPGKALPVDDGVDAIHPNSDATGTGRTAAQPASGADLPQHAAPPVLPLAVQPLPAAPGNAPIDSERSAGEERAHARKETIAALPLPIPAAVLPVVAPDTPPVRIMADAPSAASGSRASAIAPVGAAVAASSDTAAVSLPDRPVTMEATSNAATARAAASAMSRVAPEMPGVASVAAPIVASRPADAVGADPAIAQPNRRPSAVPTSPPAPIAPRAGDTTVSAPPAAIPADPPMRPARFLTRSRQAVEITGPAEQRPPARAETRVAKQEPGIADTASANAALPPSQFPKPGNAAAASVSQPETVSAVRRNSVATGAGKPGPRNSSDVPERGPMPPLPAERRIVGSDSFGRVRDPDGPRPTRAPTLARTTPAIDAAVRRTVHSRFPAVAQVDIAAQDPRPETAAADRAARPAPAPIVPQASASTPHRPAAPDALTPAAPAPSVQSAAPAVTHLAPPQVVTPAAQTHAAPERFVASDIAPAPVAPTAPAPRPAPPAVAPISAMFGGPRPIDPRTPHAAEIGDTPAGLAHTLTATQTTSPIPPVAEAQRTPLDMRRDDWTQKLIDRIETIRDAANAADTRIKLMPDALGKIDVSMRKDGDTVHVAFTADVPATRAMLADAQPRLAELAQQRGLRLGQATVDAGTTGDGQQHSADPRPIPPRPVRAAARAEALTETGRVA